jgi:hypothetical protein
MIRLAVRAGVGQRVEVVSVEGGTPAVHPGETGTLVSLDEGSVAVLMDCGRRVAVDPFAVTLRPVPANAYTRHGWDDADHIG